MTAPPQPRVLGVIPARLASTRLPRKVLRPVLGEPLLIWVYRAALACPALDHIVLAADSPEVSTLCAKHNIPCVLTDPHLPSGTDRLHAVSLLSDYSGFDLYVNIQGDEPMLHPTHVIDLLSPFADPSVDATTLKVSCRPDDITNPNAVKVVTALDGRALYFSRAAIPYDRDAAQPTYFKHLGLYAYRRAALASFAALACSPLEQTERLEQLRLLENNLNLYVTETTHDTIGVDTEADLLRVEGLLRNRAG